MAFHRLVTPSYFGGLPGGYDLINTGSAPADGAKVGGPNAGTYFHAFGEDATSVYFNRPIKALAQNCDQLDDYLHRDYVVMHKTADVLAGGAVASIVLPAGTYLGGAGYSNNAISRARLFSVRDNSDRPIIDAAIAEVVVTSVTLSGGDAIGGGFSTNTVTINLTPSIPSGTTYRVYYGVRQNLATIDTDAVPSDRDFALIYGHTTMPVGAHQAQAIWYAGGPTWGDGATTNPATTVELQLDKIISNLSDSGSIGGTRLVGHLALPGTWYTGLTAGQALDQIDEAFRGITPIVNLHVAGTLTIDNPIAVSRATSHTVRTTPISGYLSEVLSWRIEWDIGSGNAMVQNDVTGGGLQVLNHVLDLPHGCTFGGVVIYVQGAEGHSALPTGSERLQLFVYKQALATGVVTEIANIFDTTGSIGSYELPHLVSQGFAPETVDNANFMYFLQITGERGANAVPGLRYYGATISKLVTQL
jgi:hypothetical protein